MPGEEDFDSPEHVAEAQGQEPGHPHPDITPVPEPFEDAEEQSLDKSRDDVPEEAPIEVALPESTMKWFILHTYSGFEEKVKESLLTRGEAFGFGTQIGQILIPKEDVIELRNGKKITTKRLVYPGYVLV
jgi:transcriptional antiterminator NusG